MAYGNRTILRKLNDKMTDSVTNLNPVPQGIQIMAKRLKRELRDLT